MVLIVWKTAAPATLRPLFAGTNSLVSKDVSHRLASSLVMATSSKEKWLDACKTSPTEQHGTAAKTLKYWRGVQCQTRGLFGQCRTGGLAVTKQALKPGLSNPFWVPSAGLHYDSKIANFHYRHYRFLNNSVVIKGVLDQDCNKFEVSIRGNSVEDLFTMRANLQKKVLIIGRKIEGMFDDSDIKVHKKNFPFSPGRPFKIGIYKSSLELKLVVDDKVIDTYYLHKRDTSLPAFSSDSWGPEGYNPPIIILVDGKLDVTDFEQE